MATERLPKPPIYWRQLFLKLTVWLSAEIVLGVMGLDNLADYSEFVFQQRVLLQVTEAFSTLISSV